MNTFASKNLKTLVLGCFASAALVGCGNGSDDSGVKPDDQTNWKPDNREVSVAHLWSELVLSAIRVDRARPPVQARNLFHISAAMYDAWAAYGAVAKPYLLGKPSADGCPLAYVPSKIDPQAPREQAISYAAYRLIKHRYKQSPGYAKTMQQADKLMSDLGYSTANESVDTSSNSPAALGNYIASCYIAYGLKDQANEAGSHENTFYKPMNKPLLVEAGGNPTIVDLDRWQPLSLGVPFVDQAGNVVVNGAASFLGAEWGAVKPFSLTAAQLTTRIRDNQAYQVYLDPGEPPRINGAMSEQFQWSFAMVAKWSSHLDPADQVMIDISPASIGNNDTLPASIAEQRQFYNEREGSASPVGHKLNPATGKPYAAQLVRRGDYARVLSEFWADGPNSETPPGHWFHIFNKVSGHPLFKRRYRGTGATLGTLEWDVKGYFTLGGAMHDSAIAAWGIKGWYDSSRPITAIRGMAELGQSSDPALPRYHPKGLPLDPGFIELVGASDPLVGADKQHLNKIKVKAWKGPKFVANTKTDTAGVDWVLAEHWLPYQRPSFNTPPFAGYVSGHSTYSRASAEVLTALSGDPFFPGGMSDFPVKKNEFLVFEAGPSADLTLQWATYRDASDQCSLSRIWGGIHPPMDDIAGRMIGKTIGVQAVNFAEKYFNGTSN